MNNLKIEDVFVLGKMYGEIGYNLSQLSRVLNDKEISPSGKDNFIRSIYFYKEQVSIFADTVNRGFSKVKFAKNAESDLLRKLGEIEKLVEPYIN